RNALWFQSSAETDAYCTRAFAQHLEKAAKGELRHWAETNDGLVALIVLLDQFSRNIHRGSAKAFEGDTEALELAETAINAGRDKQLPAIHRAFVYMPLEHCEDLQTQEQCVALFDQLAKAVPDEQIESFARFAIAHRDVIALFGRFPHRNEMLGRSSTPEELEHLQKHGGF
ncbi:MAG: DUF924 family protein, partial [Halioglobus sp.]